LNYKFGEGSSILVKWFCNGKRVCICCEVIEARPVDFIEIPFKNRGDIEDLGMRMGK